MTGENLFHDGVFPGGQLLQQQTNAGDGFHHPETAIHEIIQVRKARRMGRFANHSEGGVEHPRADIAIQPMPQFGHQLQLPLAVVVMARLAESR